MNRLRCPFCGKWFDTEWRLKSFSGDLEEENFVDAMGNSTHEIDRSYTNMYMLDVAKCPSCGADLYGCADVRMIVTKTFKG